MKRWLLVVALLGACGTPQKPAEQAVALLGTPPSPDEDPFFYVARPPVDAKADTKGTIGDAARPERGSRGDRALEAENAELRQQVRELKSRLGNEGGAPKSDGLAQCHACVRICPIQGKCRDDAELVCGWGVGKKRKDAMLRATTECDGALDAIRTSGAFSRIDGECPVASCQ